MRQYMILASNDYMNVNAYGPYESEDAAETIRDKLEMKYPLIHFLVLKLQRTPPTRISKPHKELIEKHGTG